MKSINIIEKAEKLLVKELDFCGETRTMNTYFIAWLKTALFHLLKERATKEDYETLDRYINTLETGVML